MDTRLLRALEIIRSLVEKGHTQASGAGWNKRVAAARDFLAEHPEESDTFRCPKCRGSHFGTSCNAAGEVETGYCHDEFDRGCRFKWDRRTQDAEVGLVRSARIVAERLTEAEQTATAASVAPVDLDAWHAESEAPDAPGWYEIKRADKRCVRAFGRDGLWWIPMTDGWISGLPAGFSWRGPPFAISSGDGAPLAECEVAERWFNALGRPT